jgi:hypothetical protein
VEKCQRFNSIPDYIFTMFTHCADLSSNGCWKSSLYPLDRRCSLLVITPGTLPRTIGTLDRIVVPKMKTKIVLTVGDYFKRVSYLFNFSNAVWLLAIP